MSPQAAIALALVLLAGNALFVGAEFALISARRSAIEPLARQGSRRARSTLAAMERVSLMMAGAQLGITVCSLGIGALGEPAVAALLEPVLHTLHVPEALLHPLAFTGALAVVVYLHMVLGEMVPKNIALAGPDRAALLLAPPMAMLVRAAYPVIWLFNALANLVLRVLGIQPKDEITAAFTSEEVARLVAESRHAGLLDPGNGMLLTSALELTMERAGQKAIPVARLVCAPERCTARTIQDLTAQTGYSRIPLVDPDGQLAGYTHVKDTLDLHDALDDPLPTAARRVLPVVPDEAKLTDAIAMLRRGGSHLAAVCDPSGRAAGVLFLEDALEELIGEIRDPAQRPRLAGP